MDHYDIKHLTLLFKAFILTDLNCDPSKYLRQSKKKKKIYTPPKKSRSALQKQNPDTATKVT